MKRRDFLRTTGRGTMGAMAAGVLPTTLLGGCVGEPPDPGFTGWSWVHGDANRSPGEWRDRFDALREAGFGGVLVGGPTDPEVAAAARGAGLVHHRWMWILNRNNDAWVQENRPEWFTVSRNGESSLESPPYVGYYKWLCPSRAEVRQYIREEISQAAADPDVDGVHLDYVRHCDVILPRGLWDTYDLVQDHEMAEYDFCYCSECRRQFLELTGRDPIELEDPASDVEWVRFRWDSVTRLVKELAGVVHFRRKPISAAVFPTPTLARRLVRQSWDEWPLDLVFPMLYHGFYDEDLPWIGDCVRDGLDALGPEGAELRSGLYLPDLDPDALAASIRIAHEAGAAGFSTFEMNGLTDAHLARVRETVAELNARAV